MMGNLFSPVHILFVLFLLVVLAVFVGVLVFAARNSSGPRPATSFRESILSIVPRPAKVVAITLLCTAVTVGIVAGTLVFRNTGGLRAPVLGAPIGLLAGTLVGCCFTIWVLALGYVYGDARQRNMPAVPWTLVAMFVPNLLGFLLYFVLRKPLGGPCPQCGQTITPEQRFCSWCGGQQYAPPYSATVAPPSPTGLDPGASG